MRNLLLFLLVFFAACETNNFESDKRQLIAKDSIRRQLVKVRSFDIAGFYQDTLKNSADTTFKQFVRYGLDIVYTDSLGKLQQKKGIVLFTPDGKSVISSKIVD